MFAVTEVAGALQFARYLQAKGIGMVLPLTLGSQASAWSVSESGYLAMNGKATSTLRYAPAQRSDAYRIDMPTPRIVLHIAAPHVGELHVTLDDLQVRD